MITPEEIAKQLVGAVSHTLHGKGPSSVHLRCEDNSATGCVVFFIPEPLGPIIDDALDRIYAVLGWKIRKVRKEETR